jgi:small subunit ribosomal protein S4
LGFAESRRQARQLVEHKHIAVNGRVTNIPSYIVKQGDVIAWKPGSLKSEAYKAAAQSIESKTIPNWLGLDRANLSGQVLSAPAPGEMESTIDHRLIVAFYSR